MKKNEVFKRYLLLMVSLFFSALGVAFTKHGELGVSPISSVANVVSCKFISLSLGKWLIIWNCVLIVSYIPIENYFTKILLVLIGIVILGFGISLSVVANVIMNSGEAFVKAISDTTHIEFGNVKIAFDVLCVVFSVLLSLVFFHFNIVGTREGTIISAILTGTIVKFFLSRIKKPLDRILCSPQQS